MSFNEVFGMLDARADALIRVAEAMKVNVEDARRGVEASEDELRTAINAGRQLAADAAGHSRRSLDEWDKLEGAADLNIGSPLPVDEDTEQIRARTDAVRDALRNLESNDPDFWSDLEP